MLQNIFHYKVAREKVRKGGKGGLVIKALDQKSKNVNFVSSIVMYLLYGLD